MSGLAYPVAARPGGLSAGLLRCVGCRAAGLVDDGSTLACTACGREFPVQAGVPVMMSDAVPERGPLLDPDAALAAALRFGLPTDPVSILRLRRASGARIRLLGAGRVLPDDGHVLDRDDLAAPVEADSRRGNIRCEWSGEYVPRVMVPGGEALANVQFRNTGSGTMPGSGDGRIAVAGQWTSLDGEAVPGADIRTPLPADVQPGQILTLAIRLQPPAIPGRYLLTVRMLLEGVRWLEPTFGPFAVHVRAGGGFVPPLHWVIDGAGPHDGPADRARAKSRMRRWVGELEQPCPMILEVGGGANPATSRAGYDSLVAGTDLLALQLGRLQPGAPPSLCAEPEALPLPEAAFDAIVMFDTLHYWPDPARTLRVLRGHLRPGGFIGVFCSPVGHVWPGTAPPAVLAGLRRGLNPQGFSLADYAQVFQSARLRVRDLVVHDGSLRARLEPESADA